MQENTAKRPYNSVQYQPVKELTHTYTMAKHDSAQNTKTLQVSK